MSLFIYQKSAAELDAPLKETLRYMGFRGDAQEKDEQTALKAMQSVKEGSSPIAVYTLNGIKRVNKCELDLGFGSFYSKDLSKYLKNAEAAVCFAATIGMHTDMLVKRYAEISPLRSLYYSSAGTNLIEAFCDAFCENIAENMRERGLKPRGRFSPGYGDFALDCQYDLLNMLDAQKRAGIYLNDNLLMTPVKSVTAVVALERII
ncbi:MAG: hypothetical protein IJP33_05105 [Firmicutes bacterium]|nr:hypothetical protein [Bacillota bacterium]